MEIEERTLVMELSGPVELNDAQLDAVAAGAAVNINGNLKNFARFQKLGKDVSGTVTVGPLV